MKKRWFKTRAKKMGLPPGSLVHIGDESQLATHISLIQYNENQIVELKDTTIDELKARMKMDGFLWVDVDGISDVHLIGEIAKLMDFHHLMTEDIVNSDQRAKIDVYENCLFIVMKMLRFDEGQNQITSEQISLVLEKNILFTFQESKPGDVWNGVRDSLRHKRGLVRQRKIDYLAYVLIDAVVDSLFGILEKFCDRIESDDADSLHDHSPAFLKRVHDDKREILYLRKTVWPMRDLLRQLTRPDNPFVDEGTLVYLRDVQDHIGHIIETIESYQAMLTSIHEIAVAGMGNQMNQVMKMLALISTVFIPLTFIVGVYGMNFEYMPEIHMKWAYPAVWSVMLGIAFGTFAYFNKKGWFE